MYVFDFLISFQVKENNLCPPLNTRKALVKCIITVSKINITRRKVTMPEVILEGHGRPNVFLAGQVGQKYKDLDSGLEYVCTGERGFIKVDGDDQSEMYNWELVESGGSTGGGKLRTIVYEGEGIFSTDITAEDYDYLYIDGIPILLVDDVNGTYATCGAFWVPGNGYYVLSFIDHSGKILNLKIKQSGQDIVVEPYNTPS